jgi:hypothetical protein
MAKRSRVHRKEIPGYSESRPSSDDRKLEHRKVRHHTHQVLHMVDDPDEVAELPEVRGTGEREILQEQPGPGKRRFRVWKTKFWKRRDDYHTMKSELDSNWPVITSEQLRQEQV